MTSLLVTWKTTGRFTGRYSCSGSTLPFCGWEKVHTHCWPVTFTTIALGVEASGARLCISPTPQLSANMVGMEETTIQVAVTRPLPRIGGPSPIGGSEPRERHETRL